MRKYATSWVVKVLLGVLIVSFAIWGIGDVLQPSSSGAALASVAREEITQDEVMREFEARYEALQESAGGAGGLTRHQAVSFGLMGQALDVTVARALLDAHARDLKLAVTDAELAEAVRRNPLFGGPAGGFERERFDLYVRSLGLDEQGYLASLRGDLVRSRLVDGVTAPVAAPAALADRLLAHRDERRRGRALLVDADESAVAAPDEATLKAYLEKNAKRYEAPEYRAVTLVVVGPDDLAGEIAVGEEELRAEYEARLGEYRTPETRAIDQLVAADEATAREAAAMVAAGQGFDAVAAALKGRSVERTQLGPLRQGDLPEALDRAVFALAQGAVSEPVASPFGWHLIRLEEVRPEETRSFEDVRADLERELRLRHANEQLPSFATRLDDEIAAGTALEQAAAGLGLQPLKIEALDRQGQNKKQEAVAADRLTPEILDAVFAAGQGEPSLLSETRDGRYYMFRVDGIEPARPRTLEEARDALAEAWREEQRAEKARARAEELRATIPDAASLDGVAAAAAGPGVSVVEVGPVKRDDQGYLVGLTPEAIEALFATPAGAVAARVVPALEGSAVLVVDEVLPAEADPAAAEQARAALADEMREGLLQAYEAALRQRYPVSVDQGQLAQMMESQAER